MDRLNDDLRRIREFVGSEKPNEAMERLAFARLKAKRGKPTKKRPPNLGLVAGKLRRKMVPKRLPLLLRIKSYWPETVGVKYARICAPLKLTGGKLDKTLHIQVEPSFALIIQHDEEVIRERLNNIGGGFIHKLRIHQGCINLTSLGEAASPKRVNTSHHRSISQLDEDKLKMYRDKISDPKLREAIEKLGRSVLAAD